MLLKAKKGRVVCYQNKNSHFGGSIQNVINLLNWVNIIKYETPMKNVVLLGLSIATIFLGGCATAPISTSLAKTTPKDWILAYQEKLDGYAEVEITRDTGFLGGGCYLSVLFRNETIGRFDTGEKATFYLPPGQWAMAVASDPDGRGLCAAAGFNPAFEQQNIKLNIKNIFRISSGPYRRPRLLPL